MIVEGIAGIESTATLKVETEEVPQEFALTALIVPLVAVAVNAIMFVVEVPVQPPGSVQV